jgi:RNA polymerase sigma-70 factor (ECF subfamily)
VSSGRSEQQREHLATVLRDNLANPAVVDDVEDLEGVLARLVGEAAAAWPNIRLAPEIVVAQLAAQLSETGPLLSELQQIRMADLFLAAACVEQMQNAIETFDGEFLFGVPEILARSGFGHLQSDEVRERVRDQLFFGAARISDYTGRTSLASWVHVVILRVAIDLADSHSTGTDPDSAIALIIEEHYRQPFKSAFRMAVGALTSEQRELLRLHFVEGVTFDMLAMQFARHRATIVWQIAQAKDSVLERIGASLQAQLAINSQELEALLTIIRSRLELGLSALL